MKITKRGHIQSEDRTKTSIVRKRSDKELIFVCLSEVRGVLILWKAYASVCH